MYSDVELRIKKKNKILFARESPCLSELYKLMQKQHHYTLVLWALDCGQQTLQKFKQKYPQEHRLNECLSLCEDWSKGYIKMPVAKKAILAAHAVSKEINDPVYGTLCHAVGHAGATVHVGTHAIGLPLYELTALVLENYPQHYPVIVSEKISYYLNRLHYWQDQPFMHHRPWASFLEQF